jgi:hypothetical protein
MGKPSFLERSGHDTSGFPLYLSLNFSLSFPYPAFHIIYRHPAAFPAWPKKAKLTAPCTSSSPASPLRGNPPFAGGSKKKKGFLHLDVEKPGVLERYGLTTAWATLFDPSASEAPFIDALEKFNRPVVIDWGFPPEHVNTVRKLFDGGLMLWWFAADWAVARRKFIARGNAKGPVTVFDIRSAKSKPPSQKSTPSSARTKSTRYPRQASTLHPKQSGEACSTPSSNPPVADSAHPGRTPPLTLSC